MRVIKKLFRWKRCQILFLFLLPGIVMATYYWLHNYDSYIVEREELIRFMHQKLQESLKEDKGTGCNIPKLDPFAKEVTQLEVSLPKIACQGFDWVSCVLSECRVKKTILKTVDDIKCSYRDMYYKGDKNRGVYAPEITRNLNETYVLQRSDHVRVTCEGKSKDKGHKESWTGYVSGLRTNVDRLKPPLGREFGFNVAMLVFESTSHSGFIRRMPKSFDVLTRELNATVLNGYNILGDGTIAAMLPVLTGKNRLEYPDVSDEIERKNRCSLDFMPFVFYKLRDDGYRTAYLEDTSTFNHRMDVFRNQPTDHYMLMFFQEAERYRQLRKGTLHADQYYCVGDTPKFQLLLNITDQFHRLDDKKFSLTFNNDISHDNFSLITTSDDEVAEFLYNFKKSGRLNDTLLFVMGDHGCRYSKVRKTPTGKLEERLPLMSIILPYSLKKRNPEAQKALDHNRDVLTTPYDIHSTILDVAGLRQHWNNYKIPGADLTRGLTLLEPIPKTRSCSEAGVESYWCSCLPWKKVDKFDDLYYRTGKALLDHINMLTESFRHKCVQRTLTSIEWVLKQEHNNRILKYSKSAEGDKYRTSSNSKTTTDKENYQAQIIVGPGEAIYEGSMTYFKKEDKLAVDTRDISRITAYRNETKCISATHPHLEKYCYCKN